MGELISVIVPAYNMENYLEKCLDSIKNQTYQNLEVIVVDDGSKDSTLKIAKRYAIEDSRFVVIHQENSGLVGARKTGIKNANGNLIGFVDADDWIDDGMYTYLHQKMVENNAQIVTSGRYVERASSMRYSDLIKPGLYHPKEDTYFCKNMIFGLGRELWGVTPNFWNKLFQKSILEKFEAYVDDGITYGEDDACVYPCMAFSDSICVTEECFYHYRMREASMSHASDDNYFTKVNKLYLVLKYWFEQHPLKDILLHELGIYMLEFALRGVNGLWGIKSGITVPRYFFDQNCLLGKKYVVLYGATEIGKCYYQSLIQQKMWEVKWVDRRFVQLQEEGYPVVPMNEIDKDRCDVIVVAVNTEQTYKSIKEDLIQYGIGENIILWKKPVSILAIND